MFVYKLIGFLTFISLNNAFIVPQELPSVLSLVYSNIPPIKKGTDSRLGFGFRLGEHADFQVLVELGPQTETRPLGTTDSNSNKRNVDQTEYNVKLPVSTNGNSWLNNWSKNNKEPLKTDTKVNQQDHKKQKQQQQSSNTKPYINEIALQQLQSLYAKQNEVQPIIQYEIPINTDQIEQ